jgi:hypothetical protein
VDFEDSLQFYESILAQNEKQINHMSKIVYICKNNTKENQEWVKVAL